MANKLTAAIGTTAIVDNPDVTQYCLCGWAMVEQLDAGHVLMRKVRN